ncbi:aldehyde dehydrogenase family protein [Brumimicrobium mesophilum]|uniref:hypothetical protein n=1 Tax=Brumimicrobium mesophilum TaxID=392717 RepID=UPI000D13F00E|nr:hypothetical protein [Brumimicrobium mesophilum]
MKHLISTLFLIVSFFSFTQIDEELENQEFDLDITTQEGIDQVLTNLFSFVGDDFDSVDVQLLLSGELIATIMVQKSSTENNITYGDIYAKMLNIKQRPEYSEYKENSIIILDFSKRPADYNNWEKDVVLLKRIEIDTQTLESIKQYIKEKGNPNLTYEEVLNEFYEEQDEKNKTAESHEIHQKFYDNKLFNEVKILEESKELDKPILLYFTGYNNVNGRKIEQTVLVRPHVADMIMDNFIFVPIYVDEKTKLPQELQKEVKDGDKSRFIKTVGDRNSFYQYSRFNSDTQPYFVVLNSDNEIIEVADYDYNTIEKFTSFLELSLENYNKQ